MRTYFLYALLLLGFLQAGAQDVQRPKLVVGIVVDQMRWDYLYRFYGRYGKDGFKRLLGEGFSCENTFIPYLPTATAPGHSCIYTGSVPAIHGIVGNSWYDREKQRTVYCTEDSSVRSVGSSSAAGKMSPKNMWTTTVTDELRLATNFQSKTISIALKDRGSILPGGHSSNGSYWFDNASGGWITSNYYMDDLPEWMKQLNSRKLPDAYLSQEWNTLYPIASYTQSTRDSNVYEGKLPGEDFTFPHLTSTISRDKYESFRYTPHGCSFTFETGKAAIEGEKLGQRNVTDFLALSLSSPDYIGHAFGPNSIEVEDTYLRLDRDLAAFLRYLDTRIGKGPYLVFLSSDHAVAHNPGFMKDKNLPTGILESGFIKKQLNDSLQRQFNAGGIVLQASNHQVFLDEGVIRQQNLDKKAVKAAIISLLLKQEGVANVVDMSDLSNASLPGRMKTMLVNSYNPKLSGDLHVIFKPQWYEGWRTGSTHSLWNPYDSHIPLIWFGWKIKPGKLHREVYMTDIAPTLAALLRIQMANGSIGEVIEEVVE
ncbi:MAG TPA: alkaline phosphatase PafA [Flavisolibacter sp.]|nr:alkaline phosphatase PafA [Flavisolibacter sp.]